ncbi:hypothetical protein RM545_04300 [Zunongwangia sp. F260]|uniref:Glycosyltransferase RgtA/B/C/D-like domain-containing protein n=1 Tax=Autumnicola lenta TaxID=3075593 RepID=A0ABU3CHT2_9FLAO|nr:hypothetical protein [Zunongwangia sp. F260]MDT0645900.1 hypothetical protein [Zunongwangia sp. F260]
MIGVLFLIILFAGLNQIIFGFYQKKHSFFNKKLLNLLYFYHLVFFGIYLWYAYNNPSDSKGYFEFYSKYPNLSWFETFGTDTSFIHFIGYPLHFIGFSYEMFMVTFSWIGFIGFVYSYLFFREKIPVKVKMFKSIDFLTLLLFLPNMHFWTASLGKGAPIFMAVMMFAYSILQPKSRIFTLFLGSLLVFYIRPHVFLFLAVGAVSGYFTGKEKISTSNKILVMVGMLGGVLLVQDQILAVVNLQDSDNLVEDFESFTGDRAENLSQKAGSGVDMASYSLPMKLFTFWFRPLFIDAPNPLGFIISFENLLYLLLFLKIIRKDFISFLKRAPSAVKMSLVIFLLTSFAMTFVMSNLGIIMRQKQMVMYFLFFVIYYFLAQKKYDKIVRLRKKRKIKEESLA